VRTQWELKGTSWEQRKNEKTASPAPPPRRPPTHTQNLKGKKLAA